MPVVVGGVGIVNEANERASVAGEGGTVQLNGESVGGIVDIVVEAEVNSSGGKRCHIQPDFCAHEPILSPPTKSGVGHIIHVVV